MRPTLRILMAGVLLHAATAARGDDIEREPIRYESAPANNAISRLDPAELVAEDPKAFLRKLLAKLDIPESSQTLVFSRTSLQRMRISPERPRALYFNDAIYVGTCQKSNLYEFSAVDPKLGVVFYATEFEPGKAPHFTRHNDACMSCHGSSATGGYPGHMVRSVFSDSEGFPILSLGTYRVDQRTPLDRRWGGWYVTGSAGKQTHLGNRTFTGASDRDVVDPKAQNRKSVDDLIDVHRYLHGHSDIAALMVLEHQAEMQNLLTRANYQTRIGMHQDRELNKELGRPADAMSETTWRRIQNAGDKVVAYLFFEGETPLTEPIVGTSTFAKDFAARGPRDKQGRSLRDLDLKTRLFKYPCSYLIGSEQFDGLPTEMKDYVLRRIHGVLTGKDGRFSHLAADDRRAILEILRETKPDLPAYWRE